MSLSLAYAALFTGIVVWLLLVRKLSARPWQASAAASRASTMQPDGGPAEHGPRPAARVGLWVFLAIVTSLFGLFCSAYYMRMGGHLGAQDGAGGHGAGDWVALQEPGVLWLNTAVLVLASVAMQCARGAAASGQLQLTWTALTLGGLLALLFLGGQWYAWQQLQASGVWTIRNPSVAFFYVLTMVHALHLLGGLFVWGRVWARARIALRSLQVEPHELVADLSLSVELCSVYWHYLLLVWLGLFMLLLST